MKNIISEKGGKGFSAEELRALWQRWITARVKEGLTKDQAEMSADLTAICKIFGLEPEQLGVARCGCGCGRILGPTMKTVRVLTTIVLVLINEHLECPPVDGDPDAMSVRQLDFAALETFRIAVPPSAN